jgi:geranylgeranyl reductase family protein
MVMFDAAVIGAGPAGSTLAFKLAKAGIKVCVLDKAKFPRRKVCAGGLPPKILDVVDFDIHELIRNEISGVSLTHRIEKAFQRNYSKPLLLTVDRTNFDDYLLRKAVDAGACLMEQVAIENLIYENNMYFIRTTDQQIYAKVIVGADGANSFTAKQLSLTAVDCSHVAIQIEVPVKRLNTATMNAHGTSIALDWGFMEDSYGWLFPNGDFVSIGVMGPSKSGKKVKAYFDQWIRYFAILPNEFKIHAHSIPHRISKRPITGPGSLLVGDAAGLADYWTGEGIYYAVKSAQLAAGQIDRFLKGEADAINQYEALINEQILPELQASRSFSKLFNHISPVAFHVLGKYYYPWDLLCRIMRGDRSFVDVKKRLRPDILLKKLLIQKTRGR